MKLRNYKLVGLISATLLTNSAFANETEGGKWGVGLGAIASDKGYIDIGTETQAIPVVFYQSENLFLFGPNFGYKVADFQNVSLKAVGQYRFDGYEEDDGDIFQGMEERSGSLDLGIAIGIDTDFGDFSIQALTDVTNEHEGNELSLSYSKSFYFESSSIEPFLTLTQQSDDLVDYYYGVRQSEATNLREAYIAESTTNVEVGIKSSYRVGAHHNFIGQFSYKAYGSEIKDSPLIDSSGEVSFILGYMYVF